MVETIAATHSLPPEHVRARLVELLRTWRSSRTNPATHAVLRLPVNPYPGLRSFTLAESGLFFGRRSQVEQLGRCFNDNNVVLVLGGSGSGKSSLVKAGLLPNLKTIAPASGRLGKWYVAECRPRTDPIREVGDALWRDICLPLLTDHAGAESVAVGFGRPSDVTTQTSRIGEACKEQFDLLVNRRGARGPILDAYGIHEFANVVLDRIDNHKLEGLRAGPPNLLLFIDQFEEIFDENKIDSESRDSVFALIDLARRNRGQALFVVLTMRSEALHRCAEDPRLVDVVNQSSFLLELIEERDVPEAITGPARAVLQAWGIIPMEARATGDTRPFTSSLVETLSKELTRLRASLVHKPDSLPLLQHTLEAIWQHALERWEHALRENQHEAEFMISEEDFNSVTGQSRRDTHNVSRHVSSEPFRRCLNTRADECLAAAIKALENASGVSSEDAERILAAAFTTLSHRDDRGNWARDFATAAKMLATSGVAQAHGITEVDIVEALKPFVSAGYLQTRRSADNYSIYDKGDGFEAQGCGDQVEYNVGHEALIRSWPWCEQQLRKAEDLSDLLAGLDNSLAERESENVATSGDEGGHGSPNQWAFIDWLGAPWRWLRAKREEDAARLVDRPRLQQLQNLIGVVPLYTEMWTLDRLTEHLRAAERRLHGEPEVGPTATISKRENAAAKQQLAEIIRVAADADRWHRRAWARLPVFIGGTALLISGYFAWTELVEKPLEKHRSEVALNERDTWVAARQYFAAQSGDRLLDGHQIELARLVTLNAMKETKTISQKEPNLFGELRQSVGAIVFAQARGPLLLGTNASTKLVGVDPKGHFVAAVVNTHAAGPNQADQPWEATSVLGVDPEGHSVRALVATDMQSYAGNKSIQLWESSSGVTLMSLSLSHGEISATAMSVDGEKIAAGSSDGEILVWNSKSGEVIAELGGSVGTISALAFQRNGTRLVAGTRDSAIWIWDLDQKAAVPGDSCKVSSGPSPPLRQPKEGDQGILTVAFDADGNRVLAGTGGKHLLLWDASSGKCLQDKELDELPTVIAFGSSSLAVVATRDRTYLLTLTDRGQNINLRPLANRWLREPAHSISFDPDNKQFVLITANSSVIADEVLGGGFTQGPGAVGSQPSSDQTMRDNIQIHRLMPKAGFRLLAADPSGRRLVIQPDRGDEQPLQFVERRVDLNKNIETNRIAVSDDRQYVAVASERTVRVIRQNEETNAAEQELEVGSTIDSLCFDPSNKLLAIGLSNGKIVLWSFADKAESAREFSGHSDDVNGIAFNQSGERLVSASDDGTTIVWNVDSGERLLTLPHPGWVGDAGFAAADTEIVTIAGGGSLRIWDATTGKLLETFPETGLHAISFDRSHAYVAGIDSAGTAQIWNLRERVLKTSVHLPDLVAARFDGRTDAILTVSRSGRVAVWLSDATRLTLAAHGDISPVDQSWVGLSASGSNVLTIDGSGKIRSEPLSSITGEGMRAVFLASATRSPTASELQQYALPDTIRAAAKQLQSKNSAPVPCIDPTSSPLNPKAFNQCADRVIRDPLDAGAWYEFGRARESARQNWALPISAPDPLIVVAAAMGSGPALNSLGDWVNRRQPRSFHTAGALYTHAILNDPSTADGYLAWLVRWGNLARVEAVRWHDEFARRARAGDPAAHFILGALSERFGAEPAEREQAFFHYAVAAKLFAERGREYSPALVRRGALARILPTDRVAARWSEAESWTAQQARNADPAPRAFAWHPVVTGVDLNNEAVIDRLAEEAIEALGRAFGPDVDFDVLRGEILLAHAKTIVGERLPEAVSLLQAAQSAFKAELIRDSSDSWSFDRRDEALALLSLAQPSSDCRGPLAERVESFDRWLGRRTPTPMQGIARLDAEVRLGKCLADHNQTMSARIILRTAANRPRDNNIMSNANRKGRLELGGVAAMLGDTLVQVGDRQSALKQYGHALVALGGLSSDQSDQLLPLEEIDAFAALQQKVVGILADHGFDDATALALRELDDTASAIGRRFISDHNTDKALALLQDAAIIRNKLIEHDQSITTWQTQVVAFEFQIGEILNDKSDRRGAIDAYQRSLNTAEKFSKRDPDKADWPLVASFLQTKIGDVFLEDGDYDRAMTFFRATLAITKDLFERNPSNTERQQDLSRSYHAIGYALRAMEKYEEALPSYDAAIRVRPDGRAYFGRALNQIYAGRSDLAVEDFTKAIRSDPSDVYSVIWLHIARTRARTDDREELSSYTQKLDKNKWPWPAAALFLSWLSPEEMRLAAESATDAKTRDGQLCEADFYIGMYQLEKGHKVEALQLLHAAAEKCPRDYIEYTAAKSELNRLEGMVDHH